MFNPLWVLLFLFNKKSDVKCKCRKKGSFKNHVPCLQHKPYQMKWSTKGEGGSKKVRISVHMVYECPQKGLYLSSKFLQKNWKIYSNYFLTIQFQVPATRICISNTRPSGISYSTSNYGPNGPTPIFDGPQWIHSFRS